MLYVLADVKLVVLLDVAAQVEADAALITRVLEPTNVLVTARAEIVPGGSWARLNSLWP